MVWWAVGGRMGGGWWGVLLGVEIDVWMHKDGVGGWAACF